MFVLIKFFPGRKKPFMNYLTFFILGPIIFQVRFYFFIHSDQYEKGITEAKIKISICHI